VTPEDLRATLDFLRRTPDQVTELTAGLDQADCAWKPAEKEFSVLENVCHLRDLEREGYLVRVRRILTEDNPSLPDVDGDRLAIARRYNDGDLDAAVRGFRSARLETLGLLDALTPGKLSRSGTLEKVGPITLARVLAMQREHDAGHLRDIGALLPRLPRS